MPRHPPCALSSLTNFDHSYSVRSVGLGLLCVHKVSFISELWFFLGCLVSFVLDIVSIFLYAVFKVHLNAFAFNGDGGIRTLDPLLARQVLSQLSYTPIRASIGYSIYPMGLSGLEPPTSRLSGVRSNRLSYKPINLASTCFPIPSPV